MSYNPNIPNPSDLLSNSQSQIKANFGQANTLFGKDHFPFDIGTAAAGTHKKSTYTDTVAPGFAGGNACEYSQKLGGDSWPVWQNTAGPTVMLSSNTNNSANGFCSLPGGMLIQWGQVILPGTSGLVTFPKAFLIGTFPLNVQLTLQRTSAGNPQTAYVDDGTPFTNAKFGYLTTSAGSQVLYYIAIGREF